LATSIAQRALDSTIPTYAAQARAWRPFPRDVADLLCIEEPTPDLQPRIHGRLAVTLVSAPAVVRAESSKSVVAGRNWILLVPAWQLYSLRAQHGASPGLVTLLPGPSHLEGLDVADRPTLVADIELGTGVAALATQLRRPMRSVECVNTVRSLLERLLASGSPVARPRRGNGATPLASVRDYLRARSGEQVSIAELASMSGLTESHLIRAFHREFGLPPHAYHMRLRLAAASELLSNGVSVSTAAYECGFADQSHLSRQFKEVYGLTPAAWAASAADVPRHRAHVWRKSASGQDEGVRFTLPHAVQQ
jgi:AraC-like DNA-binding protein